MKSSRFLLGLFFLMFLAAGSCKKKDSSNSQTTPPPPGNGLPALNSATSVLGYNLLGKIRGIWDGPVTSTTALGSYPEWIVDMRPISASQVSSKNELDTANNIFMSFFVCFHNGSYKLAFRNGGAFSNMQRVSYMEADSVSETSSQSYYRFADFVKGTKKTITEVMFHADSLIIQSFTNKYNTLTTPALHMRWKASLRDTTSCQPAISAFSFPQKKLVQDFSATFSTVTESVYYQLAGDPYTEAQQPYLGKSTLSYTVLPTITLNSSHKVFLLATTQPLFNGAALNPAGMNCRSRYVLLPGNAAGSFVFNYMHPGNYFLYAFYDANGDGVINTGDYISTSNVPFSLSPLGTATATTQINYLVP
jgi:hypothetical protein